MELHTNEETFEDIVIDLGQYDEDGIESDVQDVLGEELITITPIQNIDIEEKIIASGRSNIIIVRNFPWFSA